MSKFNHISKMKNTNTSTDNSGVPIVSDAIVKSGRTNDLAFSFYNNHSETKTCCNNGKGSINNRFSDKPKSRRNRKRKNQSNPIYTTECTAIASSSYRNTLHDRRNCKNSEVRTMHSKTIHKNEKTASVPSWQNVLHNSASDLQISKH